jgi:hypothetical protein
MFEAAAVVLPAGRRSHIPAIAAVTRGTAITDAGLTTTVMSTSILTLGLSVPGLSGREGARLSREQ